MHKVKPAKNSIWSGVYRNFSDVPAPTQVFDTSTWTDKQRKNVEMMAAALSSENVIPDSAKSRDYPLSTVAATALAIKGKLRIIDYGGAMGQTYLDLLTKIPDMAKHIDYTVIEKRFITENLPDCLQNYQKLKFIAVEDTENTEKYADIVHLGSTLQYIDDWRKLLSDLYAHFMPDFFVLSDLLVGNIPSFVTAQNYYGQMISARFINIDEFLEFWKKSMPYKISYHSHFLPLGGEDYFPNDDLPETHRLKKACHMVFKRTEIAP